MLAFLLAQADPVIPPPPPGVTLPPWLLTLIYVLTVLVPAVAAIIVPLAVKLRSVLAQRDAVVEGVFAHAEAKAKAVGPEDVPTVQEHIQEAAKAAGVEDALHAVVEKAKTTRVEMKAASDEDAAPKGA